MKNNAGLFSIGEIAKAIGITRRIILNYEAKGLVKPDVKNGENANRYYTMDTLTKIHAIRILQKLGLSLDEIRGYLDGSVSLASFIHRLEMMRDEINRNIEKLYERSNDYIERVKEVYLEEQTVYCQILCVGDIARKTAVLRSVAFEAMQKYGADITKRLYFTEYLLNNPKEVRYCAVVPPHSTGENITRLPRVRAICIYHHGAYDELPRVRDKLIKYAEENGFAPLGMCRHIYIEGPPQHKDKKLFITQVALPVAEKSFNNGGAADRN